MTVDLYRLVLLILLITIDLCGSVKPTLLTTEAVQALNRSTNLILTIFNWK